MTKVDNDLMMRWGAINQINMSKNVGFIPPQLNDCGGVISKKWYVYFSVPDPNNLFKKKRYKHFKGFGKLSDKNARYEYAKQLIEEFTQLLENGWNPFAETKTIIFNNNLTYYHAMFNSKTTVSNATFSYYASLYIDNMQNNGHSRPNVDLYRSKARQFNHWLVSRNYHNLNISQFTNSIIQEFFFFLDKTRNASGNTYGKYRNVLTTIFNYAIEIKHISVNPVHSLPSCYRVVDTAARPINYDDLIIFLKELEQHPQLRLVAFFEMFCFLRPGREIRLMKIGQIDFSRKTITIPSDLNKSKRKKQVDIPDFFYKMMRDVWNLHRYNKDYYVIGKDGVPGTEHLGKNNLRYRFVEIREKLNMPLDYKLYSLKHTGAVLAYDDDISINFIKDQMGHTSTIITEEYLKNKAGLRNKVFANWEPTFLKEIL